MLEMEMVVLLGICLSSQKHGLAQGAVSTCRCPIRFGLLCPRYSREPGRTSMSNLTVQEVGVGTEAGKLQADLRDVFSKMLSHARRVDVTMTLGGITEALGELRELEAYLERGLDVLSRPLDHES